MYTHTNIILRITPLESKMGSCFYVSENTWQLHSNTHTHTNMDSTGTNVYIHTHIHTHTIYTYTHTHTHTYDFQDYAFGEQDGQLLLRLGKHVAAAFKNTRLIVKMQKCNDRLDQLAYCDGTAQQTLHVVESLEHIVCAERVQIFLKQGCVLCAVDEVCACMCVYIYIYIYIHTHTHIHTQRTGTRLTGQIGTGAVRRNGLRSP